MSISESKRNIMVSEAYLKRLLQVHAPTGVTHCAVAHFTLLDARGSLPDLIVTTSSLLQLYSVRLVAVPESFPTSLQAINNTRECPHPTWPC